MRDLQRRFICLGVSLFGMACPFLQGAGEPSAQWSSALDLPTELGHATGVYFPANGRFYAMGGRMSDSRGGDVTTPYEYNPETNAWAFKTAPFPDNQVSHMACGVLSADDKPYIYCVGGIAVGGSTNATRRVFRYDPVADKIQTVGIDPWNESAPDTLPGGFAVVGNKLYILGGFNIGNNVTDRIFEFSPERTIGTQWARKTAVLPVPLGFVPAATVGDRIYTAGGYLFSPCKFTETANSYVFDPAKDSIAPIANIPRATGETRAVTVEGEMWIVGGRRTAPEPAAEVNIYNPETGQWRLGSPLSQGQYGFAVASDDKNVFIAGGYKVPGAPLKTTRIHGGSSKSSQAPVIAPAVGSVTP